MSSDYTTQGSLFWQSVCLLWRNMYLEFLPIFFFLLGCLICVCVCVELYELFYIFEVNPLLTASFANIFFHSADGLFILFMVGLLCCIKPQVPFILFYFYFHYSRRQIHKDIAAIYVRDYSAYFFYQVFYSIQCYM